MSVSVGFVIVLNEYYHFKTTGCDTGDLQQTFVGFSFGVAQADSGRLRDKVNKSLLHQCHPDFIYPMRITS